MRSAVIKFVCFCQQHISGNVCIRSRRQRCSTLGMDSPQDAVKSTYSKNNYVEYQHGSLNVVISSPHGGRLTPDSVPNRDANFINNSHPEVNGHSSEHKITPIITKPDRFTLELSVLLADELKELTGKRPHLIINHLHRKKMDANRGLEEATFNNPEMVDAWNSFHDFIQTARNKIEGRGLYLDIHGQKHPHGLVELGYLISSPVLNTGDLHAFSSQSSISNLSTISTSDFEEIVRGHTSLGGFLESEGFPSVPSPALPSPGKEAYFRGGFNTKRYGSHQGGEIDGIQIESPSRVLNENVADYAKCLAKAVFKFLVQHQYL